MARIRSTVRPRGTSTPIARRGEVSARRRGQAGARQRALSDAMVTRVALGAVLVVATAMNLLRINRDEFPSRYYASGVFSMLTSAHDFFFLSLDPEGFVSIDKPPLGFWVQALFAKVLGFEPLALVLPQALAGVAAVGVLFHLVRRAFGLPAGFLAGLMLALSPVNVATNRTNLVDPQLVLTSLLAAWAVIAAVETDDGRRRLGWFLAAALAIGVGFNIKSSQALLPAPAIFVVYMLAARETWWRKMVSCTLAALVVLTVGLAWALVYDAVPAEQRPWVGSTETNRQTELIFGYNAANRFQTDPNPRIGAARAPGFGWFYGRESGGQIGWLVPLAALGAVAAWRGRPRLPLEGRQMNLVLWIAWAVPQVVFFALAEFTHNYYLVMLAPAIAALSGAGAVALWERFREGGWRAWLAPLTIALTLLIQYHIIGYHRGWRSQLLPAMIGLSLPGLAALAYLRARRRTPGDLAFFFAAMALVGAMVAPTVWAGIPVWNATATAFPAGGPRSALSPDTDPYPLRDPAALAFLAANRGDARWVVATRVADDASDVIVATGLPAMALGGFIGNDPILTVEEFATKVAAGEVRFVLVNPRRDLPDRLEPLETTTSLPILTLHWVSEHCALVPWEAWRSTPPLPPEEDKGWSRRLYDCANITP